MQGDLDKRWSAFVIMNRESQLICPMGLSSLSVVPDGTHIRTSIALRRKGPDEEFPSSEAARKLGE